MRTKLLALGACGALMIGSVALAQTPGAKPDASAGSAGASATAGAAASSNFTDDQLKAFAGVAMQMQKNPGQDQAAMAKQIEASGLSVQQFNDIATQMRSNPALNAKIQSLAAANPTTAESSTSTPAQRAPSSAAPSSGSAGSSEAR